MRVAIPNFRGRVSPVFDVAERLLVAELEDRGSGTPEERTLGEESMPQEEPALRARRVVELGVTTLICGAISQPLEALIAAHGVEVISGICGDVEEILRVFRHGSLSDDRHAMPGCCGRRHRRRQGRCVGGRREVLDGPRGGLHPPGERH